MTKTKSTKRALLMSALAMVLCVSMLIGTTFAWFTDSVTSSNNRIVAGNLDIELYYQNDETNDWVQVNSNTNIFKDPTETLWEPGHTEVVKLKIVNEGSLALKYQLGVNIVSEVGSINAEGDPFKLSDYIYFGIVDGVQDFENRDKAISGVQHNAMLIKQGYTTESIALEAGKDSAAYLTMVVYMPTTVGNEANYAEGADVPVINLGLNLYATQFTSEEDSFDNQYDKDAFYTDAIVTSEEELKAALANAKEGAIIGIEGNVTWTTGAGIGSTPFIPSMTRSAAPAKNITLLGLGDDATFTAIGQGVGAIGIDGGSVTFKNLKIVDNSESYAENSWEYGYLEFRGKTVFENCEFVNAIMMEGDSAIFRKCSFNSNKDNEYAVWVSDGDATFEQCNFTGPRGIKIHEAYGSLVGTVIINNNTFIDLTKKPGLAIGDVDADTTVVLSNNTFAGTQPGDQGNYMYETDTDITTFDMLEENNLVADYVDNAADLKTEIEAADPGDTIVISGGEITLPSLSGTEGLTFIGAADGSTVVGGENASTGYGSNFGKDTTIQNVTFAGSSNGVRWSYANGGTSVFENCTFVGDSTYGFHIDQSNGATFIFNNCTFIGFNAFAGDLVKVVFNECTFLNNGNYGHTNIWSVAEINNCTFGDKASIGIRGNGKLYFDGVEESYHHEYIGSAESLFDFAKSVNEGNDPWKGQKVILVDDIDLNNEAWTPIGQTGATTFAGIFDGQGHTIKNLYIDSTEQTGGNYSSGLFGWIESHESKNPATIQNVIVDGATVKGNHNVAVIVGYLYGNVSKCQVLNATVEGFHANGDACGDKVGVIVGYVGDAVVSDCSATDCTVSAGRDAGQIAGCATGATMNKVENCTATRVTVSANGTCPKEANVNNAIIGRTN